MLSKHNTSPNRFGSVVGRVDGGRFFRGVVMKVRRLDKTHYEIILADMEANQLEQWSKSEGKSTYDFLHWLLRAGLEIFRLLNK